jgi:hypothetical protein
VYTFFAWISDVGGLQQFVSAFFLVIAGVSENQAFKKYVKEKYMCDIEG